ncbi:MAG: hypothetical protein ABI776_13730 [Nocardioidaceae bacterium]
MNQPVQQHDVPGIQSQMVPVPDCCEKTYRGSCRSPGTSPTRSTAATSSPAPSSSSAGSTCWSTTAAFQMDRESLEEIPDDEWDHTWATNVSTMFHLVKGTLPQMASGASIIGSSSVNSDSPSPTLAPVYALLASDDGGYVSGARVAVTGSTPIL